MLKIYIHQQRIVAPIGYYEFERINKVELLVSIEVKIDNEFFNDELNETVNYEQLLALILAEGQEPCQLLETYAKRLMDGTYALAPSIIKNITINILKANIPANHYDAQGCGIELIKEFN